MYTNIILHMRFTLIDLNFKGSYQGSGFEAGVFVFNQFGETVAKLMKFNKNLPLLGNTDFEIIGTKIYVAIFVYSVYASLSLKFSMSKADCNILLVSNNYISYSGYITSVDGTPYVLYMSQPSKTCPNMTTVFNSSFLS